MPSLKNKDQRWGVDTFVDLFTYTLAFIKQGLKVKTTLPKKISYLRFLVEKRFFVVV
jgi:hypothetical protein